ncbi:hypothetical protein [Sphingomonas sp.]|uniref:hypothetical protein n=1 Tax=Sphingomonas sp. TaxID=28214 RepID=UPI00286E1F02|nr:hypothetical protein [Sphingomonas sp.]
MTRPIFLVPLALLAACAPYPAPPPPPYAPPPQIEPPAAEARPCGILASREWKAWVNAMPGPNARPTLIVIGKADTPTGGYSFAWRDIRVMESYPVQVVVDLVATPPSGPATQAIVTHDVRGEWPSQEPVGSLTIRCGEKVLARISPVETAH